mgnify:CR=1 FL=1
MKSKSTKLFVVDFDETWNNAYPDRKFSALLPETKLERALDNIDELDGPGAATLTIIGYYDFNNAEILLKELDIVLEDYIHCERCSDVGTVYTVNSVDLVCFLDEFLEDHMTIVNK